MTEGLILALGVLIYWELSMITSALRRIANAVNPTEAK